MFVRLFFVAVLILIAISGCSGRFVNEAVEPSLSSAVIIESIVNTTPETVLETNENDVDPDASPSGEPNGTISNPYEDYSERRDYWRYDLFEVFRGAERIPFDSSLTYTREYNGVINDEYEDFPITYVYNITLPQSMGDEPWAEAINAYYESVLPDFIAEGDDIWNEYSNDRYLSELTYYYENAYQIENVITVIRSRSFPLYRPTISWEPFSDIFSALDGQKLCLDDLFNVERDEYRPVLEGSLLKATMRFSNYYDPVRDEEFRPISQSGIIENLNDVTFAVAPEGLVFIYPTGWADAMAAGTVFLCVPYDDLQGMLNPLYFPFFANVKEG